MSAKSEKELIAEQVAAKSPRRGAARRCAAAFGLVPRRVRRTKVRSRPNSTRRSAGPHPVQSQKQAFFVIIAKKWHRGRRGAIMRPRRDFGQHHLGDEGQIESACIHEGYPLQMDQLLASGGKIIRI